MSRGRHSIDAEHPDAEALPEFAEAAAKQVVLSAGEALFIPVGWWHHIRALEVSINRAFTAFKWPNRFEWFYSGIREALSAHPAFNHFDFVMTAEDKASWGLHQYFI